MILGGLILFCCFIWGLFLVAHFLPFFKKTPYFLPLSFFLGILFSGTVIFLLKGIIIIFLGISLFPIILFRKNKWSNLFPRSIVYYLLFVICFLFSFWLFSRTFAYRDGQILVASNEYLDFGAHVPLIRSFSKGNNFPAELPFYAGKPIFYYFLFDFTTAVLEKAGWSIALSYNLLSALSLSSLLVIIYYFSQQILGLKSRLLGFISSLLFVLTPDLSFLDFPVQKTFMNWMTAIRNHNYYLDNGLRTNPFFGGFFNINVFTNQRHLVFGFGIFLFFILMLDQICRQGLARKTWLFGGVILGLLPFWHNFVFLAVFLVYGIAWLVFRKKDIISILLVGLIIALPQLVFLRFQTNNQIIFRPGFLIHNQLTLFNFLKFWFYNFGLGLPLMIVGWLTLLPKARKFFLPLIFLFIIPNLFSFAKEPFNDHKFFCLFIIFGNILSVWAWWKIWQKGWLGKISGLILIFLLTASGMLNLLVVKNDVWVRFADVGQDHFLSWVENNSKPKDVFLTNMEIWDPITLVGRKTFLGRPHYIWAYGPDPSLRIKEREIILKGEKKEEIRTIIAENRISFLAFNKKGMSFNRPFFEQNFHKIYEDESWLVLK